MAGRLSDKFQIKLVINSYSISHDYMCLYIFGVEKQIIFLEFITDVKNKHDSFRILLQVYGIFNLNFIN